MIVAALAAIAMLLLWSQPLQAQDVRIKDLANIRGVRANQLTGFGLIIGLKGTGDSKKSLATNQAVANMLLHMGQNIGQSDAVLGSAAAVIITADLPPFARVGDTLDLRVSSVGDAKSLAGGTLISTPLKAGDGNVYVVGQGSVVVGQASGSGPQVLTVARVPSGGVVEREFTPEFAPNGIITLSLKQPDFTTNARLAEAINTHFKGFFAESTDPGSVRVVIPEMFLTRSVEFIGELERLPVEVDRKAVVVLNERTGTVVMGGDVAIGKISLTHGDLTISIGKSAGAKGKGDAKSVATLEGTTVSRLVETLNGLGVKPGDLVGIFQAIHASGAMHAELKFL
jgi:flagellar P-ring protein precursor FlgI